MNKKIIAFMIAATLLFVGIFAACNKDEQDEDEPAKLYVEGDEYPFVTDENGDKVLDENGEFIVYHTDENGKIMKDEQGNAVTQNQVFEPVSENNRIEEYGFKVELPDGWVITNANGRFENKETGDIFAIDPIKSTTYSENYDVAKQLCKAAEGKENYTATLEEDVTKFGKEFENMFCLTVSDGEMVYTAYTFTNSGNLYCVSYQSTDLETHEANCDELMKCITFKPYKYYEESTTSLFATTTEKK